jgi:DNA-binding transcriptional LysR family regulator
VGRTRANPAIELNLSLTDRVVDLAAEGSDVAVRVGPVRSVSGLRARLIHEEGRLVVAAPSYLSKRGVPETPADLCNHDRLDFRFCARADRLAVPGRQAPRSCAD